MNHIFFYIMCKVFVGFVCGDELESDPWSLILGGPPSQLTELKGYAAEILVPDA